mgnify:CR=1 FL=1
MGEIKGYISQVIGPVVDIHFDYGTEETVTLPRIHDAMEISRPNGKILIVEVQQHIGENTVRTVAMDTTDGLRRGMEAVSYGMPITMPTGDQVKGRLMNVTGDPIDGMAQLTKDGALPIHREPPKFEDLTTTQEVLYTGIKVIDLLEPYAKGGKIGLFGCGFVQSIRDLPDIIGAVGHPQCGRKGGCFQKTIFHRRISHPVFLS